MCGRIISDEFEWRTFESDGPSNNKNDPNRVGGPENALLDGIEFTTTLDGGTSFARLQNREALTTQQRNLLSAYTKTSELVSLLGLPKSISDLASEYFKRVHNDKDLNKGGRKTDAFVAACIFCACRKTNVGRTIRELEQVSGVQRKHIGRCISKIKKAKIMKEKGAKKKSIAQVGNFLSHVERLAKRLELSLKLTEAAKDAEKQRAKLCLAEGKQPDTVVAALILLVVRELDPGRMLSESDVAAKVSVSAPTIQGTYNSMRQHKDKLIIRR